MIRYFQGMGKQVEENVTWFVITRDDVYRSSGLDRLKHIMSVSVRSRLAEPGMCRSFVKLNSIGGFLGRSRGS